MTIRVHILGAGSMVGRSCFIVEIAGVSILIDLGVHVNTKEDAERVPVLPEGVCLDAVFISHYHLDHIGSFPRVLLANNSALLQDVDVFMSEPTRILSPPLLVDYCKGSPNSEIYFPNQVYSSFKNVRTFGLGERISLRRLPSFHVTPMYAGHVLGGVMFLLQYNGKSVVYTGDYSVNPDSQLRPADIPPTELPVSGVDVVISEATHATTVSHRNIHDIEMELCGRIDRTLQRGGKVLIPIFAVGRTQELASIIRRHLGPSVPLFTTSAAGRRTSVLASSVCTQWTRSEGRQSRGLDVLFLPDTEPFPERSVVFASPAMIEGGASLRLFFDVCEDSKNLVLLTGFCSHDTVGNSVILFASRRTANRTVSVHGKQVSVNCECGYIPFSNHTDSVGIERVIRQLRPKQGIILVHGERRKIETFRENVLMPIFAGERIEIPNNGDVIEYADSPTAHASQRSVCVTRTIGTCHIIDLPSILRDYWPHCQVTQSTDGGVSVEELRRPSGPVTIETIADGYQCSWTSRLSGEWAATHPLFLSFRHLANTRPTQEDSFSISSCSE
jgi:integrator complex subunit 11